MSKHILCGIALALLLLSGCASNPDVQVVELSRNTIVYDEIIRINNCGGRGDSEQIASREFATTVELGAGGGANYQVVQANLSAKYSEYRSTSRSQRLVAPPGTNMEFVLRWSNDVRAGNVQVNGKGGTYEVRIPVSVEQISSRDLGCGISVPVQPTIPSIQPTQQSSSSVGVYTVSCDWARDWKKQPDGSYIWIGQPPGTRACQNVGQAGDLLQRLRNGENITLICPFVQNERPKTEFVVYSAVWPRNSP
jgi:hypothetical protein